MRRRSTPLVLPLRLAIGLGLALGLSPLAPSARADEIAYVDFGGEWAYLQGTEEASTPDAASWRLPGFDDSLWARGAAPFGYGDPPFGTAVDTLAPPMRGNYSSFFLRATFSLSGAGRVSQLEARVNYDDGFVLWINGTEVARGNMPGAPGSVVTFDGFAQRAHESGAVEVFPLPPPGTYLREGTNAVAVMVFNNQINSSDLKLDLALVDPIGVDVSPPRVAGVVPGAGSRVRALSSVEVTFDEPVAGVDAADLLVASQPAASVAGSGRGPYRFEFPAVSPGRVAVAWAAGHAIADLADPPNAFEGGSWSYVVDPDAPGVDLVIREILATNRSGLQDEDGDTSEWIEIQNRGDETASLRGWSLSDDPEDPAMWIFPDRLLGARERIVVFASGKDRRPISGNLHASFRLDADGEFLGLWAPGTPRRLVSAFQPRFPPQRADISWGVTPSGSTGYFDPPSPGAPEPPGALLDGIVAEPRFSVERGFYEDPFDLELTTSTPGATIRYTLDGSEPTATRGTVAGDPIPIAGSEERPAVAVRAVAYRSGWLSSRSVTHTYIFADSVLHQVDRPPGFPTRWGSAPSVDYGVDLEIANDPTYRDRLRAGLLSLAAVSIVSDVDSIFGPGGIYSNPGGSGSSWERAGSLELFYPPGVPRPTGRRGLQVNCAVRMQGGASRNPGKSPKHSFRLLFKGIYGPTKLHYPLFEDSAVEEFDTVTLRAGYNNSWIHWDSGQRARCQYLRDQWVRDALLDMGDVQSHGTFVNLWVDGLYWGLYNLVERPSAPFAASHFGGEKEEYDAYNSGRAVDGSGASLSELMARAGRDLSVDANYRAVADYLDIPAFCDYMIVNFFGANSDWPGHNWYAARRRVPGGKLHFLSWDAERTLESVNANRTGVSDRNSPGYVHSRLVASAEYRRIFADRVQRHFSEGGTLDPLVAIELWTRRADQIELAVVGESARWGDYRRDVHSSSNGPYLFYTPDDFWFPERQRLLASYFPRRSDIVLGQFRSRGLFPALEAPAFDRPTGAQSRGASVAISKPGGGPGEIWYTSDGSDPRVELTGEVAAAATRYTSRVPIQSTTWLRARVRDGADWSPLSEAVYTVPSLYADLRVTEILYNAASGPEYEFLELTNLGGSPIDLSGAWFSDGIELEFALGSLVAPGEAVVLAANADAFRSRYPGVGIDGVYRGSLSNSGERVTLRDALGSVVLTARWDDDGFWPLAPDGLGRSLVLADPDAPPDRPEAWRASAELHGSPGREDPAGVPGGVVISEILSRSPPPLEDAIELHNPTAAAIDISGWFLSDDRASLESLKKFRIPAGSVIPAGGYAVFYENELNAGGPADPKSFALDGSGDQVYLASADAARDLTGYLTGLEFDAFDAAVSFGRHETSQGPEATPFSALSFGSEGAATVEEFRAGAGAPNAPPLVAAVGFHEIHYHPVGGELEFLELFNRGDTPVALHDAASGRGWRVRGISDATGTDRFEFPPGAEIDGSGLLLLVPTDPEVFRARYAVPPGVPIHGPFGGSLDNGGERLRLLRPAPPEGGREPWILVDQVRYDDEAPWPAEADGRGRSLERVAADEYGGEPENWQASRDDGGTPGRANSVGPPLPNRPPVARFVAEPAEGDPPLQVRFDATDAYDPDGRLVAFEWDFGDGERGTGTILRHTFGVEGLYDVVLTVRDDEGAEASTSSTVRVGDAGAGGLQIPGDCNQDASLDISDPICLLGHLFLGRPPALPCGSGAASDPGNRKLADVNGDLSVDLTDPVYLLIYLFQGGSPPAAGFDCRPIAGCPSACAR